eukprot:scpid79150/ scgid29322/ 
MSVILTSTNAVSAVSSGRYTANFTLNIKEFDTRGKTIHLESAQFELHHENVSERTNKLYITDNASGVEDRVSISTGTYTDAEDIVLSINASLAMHGHGDVSFSYSRLSSRITASVPTGKTCVFKNDSPGVVLGAGEVQMRYAIRGVQTFSHAVDLTVGRRMVLLYTDLIAPSIQYEDNVDSRVLKTFLVQTLNGVNNYVFSKDDKRILLGNESVRQMTFWLKFNTGELITAGYPIYLDLRIENISSP